MGVLTDWSVSEGIPRLVIPSTAGVHRSRQLRGRRLLCHPLVDLQTYKCTCIMGEEHLITHMPALFKYCIHRASKHHIGVLCIPSNNAFLMLNKHEMDIHACSLTRLLWVDSLLHLQRHKTLKKTVNTSELNSTYIMNMCVLFLRF